MGTKYTRTAINEFRQPARPGDTVRSIEHRVVADLNGERVYSVIEDRSPFEDAEYEKHLRKQLFHNLGRHIAHKLFEEAGLDY